MAPYLLDDESDPDPKKESFFFDQERLKVFELSNVYVSWTW